MMDHRHEKDFHKMDRPPLPPMGKDGNTMIILTLFDATGRRMRVRDCEDIKIYVWTRNPNNYLVFNKRDVKQEMFEDILPIPEFFMKDLESGILQYTYTYSVHGVKNPFIKVRTITTEIYWKNHKFHEMPHESFNSHTMEFLQDQLDQEKVDRYNQFAALENYVKNEYTNKLEDEVARATEAENEIKTKLEAEIKRSNEVDIQMFNLIKEVEAGAKDNNKDVEDKVVDSDNRAQEAESNLQAAIDAETKRATKAEQDLNGLITNLESNIENVRDSLFGNIEEVQNNLYNNIVEVQNNLVSNIQEVQKDFDNKLNSEINRAKEAEKELDNKFTEKIKTLKEKAISFDEKLKKAIEDEKERSNEMDVKHTNEITIETNRAKAEEARIESLVSTEKNRATIIEGNLQTAIETETTRAKLVEKDLAETLQSLKSAVNNKNTEFYDAIDAEVVRAKAAEKELSNKIDSEISRATIKESELSAAIEVINGDGVGSINHAVEEANHYTDEEIAKLKLENNSNLTETLKDYATKAEVDGRIKDVIGTAPEALDTLGEIAEQLGKDNDAIKAINEVLTGKVNKEDVYTKSEIDKKESDLNIALNAETNRATIKENEIEAVANKNKSDIEALSAKLDNHLANSNDDVTTINSNLNDEILRAKQAESDLSNKIDSETSRATLREDSIEAIANKNATDIQSLTEKLENHLSNSTDNVETISNKLNEEITRAKAAEAELTNSISAETSRATVREDEIEAKVTKNTSDIADEVQRAKDAENTLSNSINELKEQVNTGNTNISDLTNALNAEISRATSAESSIDSKIDNEVARATGVESELANSIQSVKQSVDTINTTIDSVKVSITDEVNRAKQAEVELSTQLTSGLSSLEQKVKDEYATKDEVDGRIKDIIGTAPAALDTLGEIAEQLSKDDDAIKAINSVLTGKADADNVYTKSEVDTKVSDLNIAINSEIARATASENTISSDLANEVSRATTAEANLQSQLDIVNGNSDTIGSIAHCLEDAKHYTDDEIAKLKGIVEANENSVKSEVERATQAEAELQSQINDRLTKEEAIELISELQKQIDELKEAIKWHEN